MAEFTNIGLKQPTYGWISDFRHGLERHLKRRVTYSEAVQILITAQGATAAKAAQQFAREQVKGDPA